MSHLKPKEAPFKTLIIGGGYLGLRLAAHYIKQGPVDVLTRSYNKKVAIQELGCGHFVHDITNSTFKFPFQNYQRVILNAAVTIDALHKHAKSRLYIQGTSNVLAQMRHDSFKGTCLIVGSTGAIPNLSAFSEPFIQDLSINEEQFQALQIEDTSYAYEQYLVWKRESQKANFPILLLLSAGIYGPNRIPAKRVQDGLIKTNKPPNQWLNFIHIEDLTQALVHLEGQISKSDLFFLSDGRPLSVQALYAMVSHCFELENVGYTSPPQKDSGKKICNQKLLNTGFSPRHSLTLKTIKQLVHR